MDITVPEVGESIYEAIIGTWHKKDGDKVNKDDLLLELETDKINLEIHAEESGILSIKAKEGETVEIGSVIGTLTPSDDQDGEESQEEPEEKKGQEDSKAEAEQEKQEKKSEPKESEPQEEQKLHEKTEEKAPTSPSARQAARDRVVDLATVKGQGPGGRIRGEDVPEKTQEAAPEQPAAESPAPKPAAPAQDGDRTRREPMTPIRKRIAERLLQARQQTAMLTTFNEADMSRVIELRHKQQEHFQSRHGVKLGFMSFFVKACVAALKEYPLVNARIDRDSIVYHDFYDIGVAVATERGLVVPVLRDADQMHFADIEKGIADFAERARNNKLALQDLQGGTFTISNGGVYGSMLSTPILNPPQSAVLGMHNIQDRAMVRDGEIVIRPMMYLALSYDHRIIDGREAVSFLKLIKDYIEAPEELLLEL